MNEVKLLTLLELRSLYGINKLRHEKDKKVKRNATALCGVWIFLLLLIFFYVGAITYGYITLGLSKIVMMYLSLIASILVLVFGIFKAGESIFGKRGYDILSSMPIRSDSIVLSRFLAMYVEDLLLTLVIMLPGTAVYGFFLRPSVLFYVFSFIGSLFIPLIPLTLSVLFGTLLFAVSSRAKHKSIVQSALAVIFVVAVIVGSTAFGGSAESLDEEFFRDLVSSLGDLIARIYPPAAWLGDAITEAAPLPLLGFAAVSALSAAITVFAVSRCFHAVCRRLMTHTAHHNYKLGGMSSRGLTKTLLIRETKRYFASSIYVTNTIIGPILSAIMCVSLAVSGIDSVKSLFPFDVTGILPYAVSAIFCMMTTTSVSISMEGRQIWVIKSLPIPTKAWLDSKLLLNLSLMLPFYIVSTVAVTVAATPSFTEGVFIFLVPALMMLFSTVFGISVNLRSHKFDWEKEETVVKQSLPAAVGGFAGLFVSFILGAAVLAVPTAFSSLANSAVCIILTAVTALLYRKNNKADITML